ncbi:MAG TPA: GAF domain-containing protein, partial [Stellaceae bacterium]|nr:GAF domain-containing protein [Stellaceae bacterium]
RAVAERGGVRTNLLLPLRKDDVLLGVISCNRQEVRPFTDKQIALLENFAAQAVIAIENARLITETQEALDQQTATAEVLGVINSSPGDLAPVFEAMLEKAMRLCEATFGQLAVYEDGRFRTAAARGMPAAWADYRRRNPPDYGPGTQPARLLAGEPLIHIRDLIDDDAYRAGEPNRRALVDLGGVRTSLMVPLRREGQFLGFINIYRQEVRPFSDKDIALLQNFAAQAVIAMENARLLGETQEALDRQTATAEVLQVINSSPGNLAPVFEAMLEKAIDLCDGIQGTLWTFDGERAHLAASQGLSPKFVEMLRARREHENPGDHDPVRRIMHGERLVQILDVGAERLHGQVINAAAEFGGVGTIVFVALVKDTAHLGAFAISRRGVQAFTDKQIALLQNFAAQAVIAMENARLMTETRSARDVAEGALGDLRTAQASLIQAEKMASLGQLTAGIAHEIKNPLNFVNNFASLSVELLEELKEAAAPGIAALGEDKREEVDETMAMLSGNLEKIGEHGRRADNIVKSMLEHSRGVTGERREVDLNALVEESLNLAYHGARAQDQSFNITLERAFDPALQPIELVPQDMTRVFLNLFGNGFYAANKRAQAAHGASGGDGAFRPVLTVATREAGDAIEIRVRDNGTGIPSAIRDKLFQPFFTTKPTGEGTGLGLSISYDIVTQQHGGTIAVASEEGAFTEFTIRLPRGGQATRPAAPARAGT